MIANLLNYIIWDPDPILAHLGPLTIRYYSTCWLVGLLLGYLLMQRLYKEQKIEAEKFEPLFLYIFIGILVGARLGHCLFYQPEYFLSQWDHVIEMLIPFHHMPDGSWKLTGYEGLASHGGVFGMFVAIWLYCHNVKVKGWVVLDNMGICSGIAAMFIRLGNLMNSEIIGKVTDVPWHSSSSRKTNTHAIQGNSMRLSPISSSSSSSSSSTRRKDRRAWARVSTSDYASP